MTGSGGSGLIGPASCLLVMGVVGYCEHTVLEIHFARTTFARKVIVVPIGGRVVAVVVGAIASTEDDNHLHVVVPTPLNDNTTEHGNVANGVAITPTPSLLAKAKFTNI